MSAEAVFEFVNDSLKSKSFAAFEEMRGNGELLDISIRLDNEMFSAHRLVLSAAIPYFRVMFSSNMSESKMQDITMKKTDSVALECLINYAYTGRINITEANVESLLVTSEFLQVTEVKESCCKFLSERLSPDNVISVKVLAENINCLNLAQSVETYVAENFDDVCAREDIFLSMPFEFVKDLIRRDDLHTESEEKVFEAVMKWVKSDSERASFLKELLTEVRMSLLPPEFLVTRVSKEELIRTSIPCRDLVDEAKHIHLLPDTVLEKTKFGLEEPRWKAKSLTEKHVGRKTGHVIDDWDGWGDSPANVSHCYSQPIVSSDWDDPWKYTNK